MSTKQDIDSDKTLKTADVRPADGESVPKNAYDHTKPLPPELQKQIEFEAKRATYNNHARLKRSTFGLDVFDNILFNAANIGVFALSVWATYKTNLSNDGNWLEKRTKKVIHWLTEEKKYTDKDTAKNLNMVAWSFFDGLVALPFIAIFKHFRSDIGKAIDNLFGIVPENEDVYKNQPPESFKSVFLGRLAAFFTVIPTFFMLNSKDKNDPKSLSLNEVLFVKPAEWITKNNVSGIRTFLEKKNFNKQQVEGLIEVGVFETFYTTLCSAVLFVVSPITARLDREKKEKEATKAPSPKQQISDNKIEVVRNSDAKNNISNFSSKTTPKKEITKSENHAASVENSRINAPVAIGG